ncbi:MAG TPA: YcgL domain-containing protein [Gammaproteobacteria bacterium]|nr:YcgL domain-containing protein [Gammaproteobacteria bacterium]
MKCYVFKSLKQAGMYIYLSKEDGFDEMDKVLRDAFGQAEFVIELILTPESRLARYDAQDVISALETNGFFLQLPPADPALEPDLTNM